MAVHFLFVYSLFVQPMGEGADADSLAGVWQLFGDLWPALLLLFVSHGYSFFANFIRRGEYRSHTVKQQMSEPYSRIIFMHLVLILGGGLTLVLGQTTPVLVGIIVLKVVVDVRAHLKEHAER